MEVIIMRHGQATFSGLDRVLTNDGINEVKNTARNLCAHFTIDTILSSPKTRAVQTAQIVQETLSRRSPQVEILSDLTPSGDPDTCFDYLQARFDKPNDHAVLLVSHIPLVQKLVEYACPQTQIPVFVTGSAFILDYSAPSFVPKAFFTPGSELYLS